MPKYLYMIKSLDYIKYLNYFGGIILIIGIENLKEKQKEKEESE